MSSFGRQSNARMKRSLRRSYGQVVQLFLRWLHNVKFSRLCRGDEQQLQLCHICTVCSTVNVVATLALSVLPLLQATAIIVHDKSGKVRAALFAGKDLRRIETAPRLTRRLDCSVPVLMSSALSGKDTGTQAPYGKPYQICVPSIV